MRVFENFSEIAKLWRTLNVSAAMAGGQDKWIRSIKDNPAGKLVADPEGNRREWERAAQEDTSRLLRKFNNDELANEQTDLV